MSYDERAELGIFTIAERTQPTLPGVDEQVIETSTGSEIVPDSKSVPSVAELAAGLESGRCAPTVEDNTPARGVAIRADRLADVHAVRRQHGARRQLPRLPQLRQHQRLQLTAISNQVSPATLLADEFVRHREETDVARALWSGLTDHLERWDDISAAGQARLIGELVDFVARARATPASSTTDRLLLDTIEQAATSRMHRMTWEPELGWVNHATGIFPSIVTFLPRFPLVTADHGTRYLAKIAAFPVFLQQWNAQLVVAAAEGRAPIVHLVDSMVAALDRLIAIPLSAGPLGRQTPPTDFDDSAAERWTADLHALLDDRVAEEFGAIAGDDRWRCPRRRPPGRPAWLGVHRRRGDLYEHLIRAHTTLDMTAAEVHAIGLSQIDRLGAGVPRDRRPSSRHERSGAILARLRDDPELHYSDSESVVADATTALERAAAVMHEWFDVLPQAGCVASSIEQGALAFYSPPARDGSKPGTFFFNTADPTAWGTYQLEAVTFHESIPGHHLQMTIAQETPGLHPLLGRFFVNAYGEGWGLYTERLADEMGLYSSPLDRIGMLAADSMRACRLVVDTGIHALGWSRQQAIDYMLDNSPLSSHQVAGEIDRYIGTPGQAVSYMIGRIEIERLRESTEARLGDRFDIRGFPRRRAWLRLDPVAITRAAGWCLGAVKILAVRLDRDVRWRHDRLSMSDHDVLYDEPHIEFLEAMWGQGYLSPGGPEEVARVLEGIDLRGVTVLDIGCGSGGIAVDLVRNHGAGRVIGIDVERPCAVTPSSACGGRTVGPDRDPARRAWPIDVRRRIARHRVQQGLDRAHRRQGMAVRRGVPCAASGWLVRCL